MKNKIVLKKIMSIGMMLTLFMGMGCGKETGSNLEKESIKDKTEQESTTDAGIQEKEQSSQNTAITIINHPVSSKKDGIEYANGKYPEIILSEELSKKYPKLKERTDYYNDIWKNSTENDVALYASWNIDNQQYNENDGADSVIPYASEYTINVVRVDDRMFSIIAHDYEDCGGAHPNHGTSTINFDPASGNSYSISQILNDKKDFAKILRDKMDKENPGLMEEVDSYHFGDGDVFEDKLSEDYYTWTLTDEGLHLYFSPYEIASYATGYIDLVIGNDEYPELIQDIFKQQEKQDLDSMIKQIDGNVIEVEPNGDIDEMGTEWSESEEETGTIISNPTWKNYLKANDEKIDAKFISLTQTKEDKSDWLDTEVWAAQNGFELATMPYTDGQYTYKLSNPIEFDYMYTKLEIYDAATGSLANSYDLRELCNGPDQEKNVESSAIQYIRWARIVDDVLYVSIGHAGYASEEPWSNYMVAIDMIAGDVLWRSVPLVSNASNFKIVGDTVICGYGFTSEPDYIYLLNRYTGDVVESIPVASAPYQFEIVDNTLYVATYNTAYEFTINE